MISILLLVLWPKNKENPLIVNIVCFIFSICHHSPYSSSTSYVMRFSFLFFFFPLKPCTGTVAKCFGKSGLDCFKVDRFRYCEEQTCCSEKINTMLRQVSSRNQRAKGFRVKHVLQMTLFLAVSVWLLYQIKHSHDNKKAYEEGISKNLPEFDESRADISRLGRKDFPRTVETDSVREARIEEVENEEVGDAEQENKREGSKDERGGGVNDGIDKQDQERLDEQSDDGEEVSGDVNGEVKESGLFEEQEHEEVSHEAREKSFKGDDASSAVVHETQLTEHEERSQEAQEIHFKGDDASSAVAHDAQVTEHEEGSHEEREKSFNGDDASSAVEQNTQLTESESESENEGSGGVDKKQLEKIARKEVENETVANGTVDGLTASYSSAPGPSEFSKTHDSSVILENSEATPNNNLPLNGNSLQKRESEVGASPTLEDGSSSSSTAGESNNHTKQQADGNQTEPHTNSTNVRNNEMELQTNPMTTSGNTMEPQVNSTIVSNDQVKTETNITVIDTVTNGVSLQNESATLASVQDQNATVKVVTPSENKSNLENIVREQAENSNAAVRPEEAGGSSTTSSATDEDRETTAPESSNSFHNFTAGDDGDAHTDQPTLQGIQNKAKRGGEEATE